MKRTSGEKGFLILAILVAALPFAFSILRVITTGNDWRYLWAACGAFAGSGLVIGIGAQRRGGVVTIALALVGLIAGTVWAGGQTILTRTGSGAAVWIVAFAFSLCETAGALLYFISRPRAG